MEGLVGVRVVSGRMKLQIFYKHIRNIYASGELIREATVSKMETVQIEGGRMLGPQIVTNPTLGILCG